MVSLEALKDEFENIGVETPKSVIEKCKKTAIFQVKIYFVYIFFSIEVSNCAGATISILQSLLRAGLLLAFLI